MEDILQKLVAFRTVADDPQSIHEALDYIANFVGQRGMYVERYELDGHESLVATIKPGYKTPKVLLSAHLDVTPAPDELFEIRESEGKLYGRGTLDMKFAIAAYLQLVDDLQEKLTNYDFGIMITSDEELGGMAGVKKLLEEGYIPKVCILPDGGDNWQVQLASKGFYYLRFRAYGTPAHGSRPWLGVNAIEPIMDTLRDVQALFGARNPESSTINLGLIQGGSAINQVADYAEAAVDIRGSEAEKQALLARIREICVQRDVELEVVMDGSATLFDKRDPMIEPFIRHIQAVTGVEVVGSHTLGSNDTRFFAPYNIPCISVYPPGGGHHSSEEWLSREGFGQFKEVLGRYLDEIAAEKSQ